MLEVRLFGRFEIKNGKKTVGLASRPAQSLFAFLILNAGTQYRREKLAGQLWPEATEANARDYLRHAIWRIRKSLESASSAECLRADDLTVEFDSSSDFRLDVAALRSAREAGPIEQLAPALAVYTGELLPGFYDEWIVLEREHLQAIFERKISGLLDLLRQSERWAEVLEWSERWIALGQKPEAAYRHLMSAFAAQGDMAKAVDAYERCIKSLAKLGVEPSEQTRQLHEQLKTRKLIAALPAPAQPTASQQYNPASNIPVPLSSFVGREQELKQLAQLLTSTRVLTLTGAGGVGKTRLAMQVANRVGPRFKDGVCWVELAPLADPDLVPQAIASALELQESGGQSLAERLKQYFSSRKALLILDNCEHLILACAQIVELLAEACPNIKILTTSREALDIPGESAYEVPVLSMPRAEHIAVIDRLMKFESVRLFVERARSVRPDFALTEQNAADVYQICRRLDGIPLALELAAARTKLLTPEHIARRLNDRFSLLTGGGRTSPPRQQTLRATIDWSYDLLPEDAQVLFRRLSVFAAGFTLEAAESICSEAPLSSRSVLDLLARLVDRSLVKVVHRGPSDRYSMLETIREYAHARLVGSNEVDQARSRHCDYFVRFAESAAPKLKGAEQLVWLDQVEAEHDNLRLAWDSALESRPELALRLASALLDFWHRRGNLSEGREWASRLLERTGHWGQTAERARLLGITGWLAFFQHDFPGARQLLEQSLVLARALGDQKQAAFVLQWLGLTLLLTRQDDETAKAYLEECLATCQELQDDWGVALAIFHLSAIASYQGRHAAAEEQGLESLARFRVLGDRFRAASLLNNLGENARAQASYERARTYYEQSLKYQLGSRSRYGLAVATENLAWVVLHDGDKHRARALFEQGLRLSRECGNQDIELLALTGLAAILGQSGKTEQAVRLFSAVEMLLEVVGVAHRWFPTDRMEVEKYLALIRDQMDETAFSKAWALGRVMTLEQATALALEESRMLEESSQSPRQSRRKSHRGSHTLASDS